MPVPHVTSARSSAEHSNYCRKGLGSSITLTGGDIKTFSKNKEADPMRAARLRWENVDLVRGEARGCSHAQNPPRGCSPD